MSSRKFLLPAVLLVMVFGVVFSRPGNIGEFDGEKILNDRCKEDDEKVIIVCQQCAKQTKSNIVYPMCCQDEDDAFSWCLSYINYGQPSNRTARGI